MRKSTIESWLVRLADPASCCQELPEHLSPDDWHKLIVLAADHGVLPQVICKLTPLIEDAAGEASASAGQRSQPSHELKLIIDSARQTLQKQSGATLLLQVHGAELQRALSQAAVPAVLIKGHDFAQRLYPHPGLRVFRDIDILVPKRAVPAAEQVLRQLGYENVEAQGGKYPGQYGESAWRHRERPAVAVELHWNLINCPSQRRNVSVTFDDLQMEQFQAGGSNLQRLSSASILLLASVHAALGHRFDRLQLICDIGQASRAVAGPIDEAWLREAMCRTGATTAVQSSLSLAEQILGEPRSGQLRDRICTGTLGPAWRFLLNRALVLRSQSPLNKLRRQAVRELLKRAA